MASDPQNRRSPTADPAADRAFEALARLRDALPRLLEILAQPADERHQSWLRTLDTRLLPRLSPDFPLIAAITGGGSSGKSTLFNSLLGAALSTVGGRAGLNRRVLVAVHPTPAAQPAFLAELFRPFGSAPAPLVERDALTTPGPPVYVTSEALPPSVILLDTPDFDVGAGGHYLNRDVAEPVLTAADVLVYIFTNATYNAKANTDFIREQLTRIGRRPCILVYRAYASFAEQDVLAHAETVAHNLYGSDWRGHVLGLFRSDDSNAVAAGEALSVPRRVGPGGELLETLHRIDPRALRSEQNALMVGDIVGQALEMVGEARAARRHLAAYRDALRVAEAHAIAHALKHLPLSRVAARMRVIFERSDPGFLRFSRRAGRVTGAPFRGLVRLVGRLSSDRADPLDKPADPVELTRVALIEAANQLRRQTLAEELTTATTRSDPHGSRLIASIEALAPEQRSGDRALPRVEPSADGAVNLYVPSPAALAAAREQLLSSNWAADLAAIGDAAEALLEVPQARGGGGETIVREFREDLPFFKRTRAALVASLNLLPPVLGIGYVLATADPVGGGTLAGKLSSLFGLNDLWATVTIPASSGLDQATRRDLERLLQPVLRRWLDSRAAPVQALFRERISGTVLSAAGQRIDQADAQLALIDEALGGVTT